MILKHQNDDIAALVYFFLIYLVLFSLNPVIGRLNDVTCNPA